MMFRNDEDNNIYIEGDSDVIDEMDEHNLSAEGLRKTIIPTRRGLKSDGEFDVEDNEESIDHSEFIKGVLADNNLVGNSHLNERKTIKEPKQEELILKSD